MIPKIIHAGWFSRGVPVTLRIRVCRVLTLSAWALGGNESLIIQLWPWKLRQGELRWRLCLLAFTDLLQKVRRGNDICCCCELSREENWAVEGKFITVSWKIWSWRYSPFPASSHDSNTALGLMCNFVSRYQSQHFVVFFGVFPNIPIRLLFPPPLDGQDSWFCFSFEVCWQSANNWFCFWFSTSTSSTLLQTCVIKPIVPPSNEALYSLVYRLHMFMEFAFPFFNISKFASNSLDSQMETQLRTGTLWDMGRSQLVEPIRIKTFALLFLRVITEPEVPF